MDQHHASQRFVSSSQSAGTISSPSSPQLLDIDLEHPATLSSDSTAGVSPVDSSLSAHHQVQLMRQQLDQQQQQTQVVIAQVRAHIIEKLSENLLQIWYVFLYSDAILRRDL